MNFIEKLEGERNWVSWKFVVELQLTVQKAMPVVQGKVTEPEPLPLDASENEKKTYTALKCFEDLYAIARYIIGSSVRQEPKNISICKTSKYMWDALHRVYEERNE
ncbi:hypothetical protein AVEN_94655-1 [Araneus ventricosus]|uniref:Retrovirus-related Pol polyprotein from transposon TNT 1-94 n=1 Tax=Araneus ventricosus TaxID=182803 RepID=A0A4Y2N0J8_ARAVE|nr:hypothetical protein AVEN_94655-1 [Araneus ventricosus]